MDSFDARQTITPILLLQIVRRFRELNPGEFIEILGDDEGIAPDLRCILSSMKYELSDMKYPEENSRAFRIRLTKRN